MFIENTISNRSRIVKCCSPQRRRKYLELADKLRAMCRYESKETTSSLLEEFGIAERTLRRYVKNKQSLQEQAHDQQALTAKRALYAKYPAIDDELLKFVKFARELRLPVTRHLMQERAKMVATTFGVDNFGGSNGFIEKLMRRWNILKSVHLHGRGGSVLPPNHEERMSEISAIAQSYRLENVYNMDESGLFYRLGSRMSYLSPTENRQNVLGTDLQRNKNRITIVLRVNGDGSHTMPVSYIGHVAGPSCIQDSRFNYLKSHYNHQSNAWMDSSQFQRWINWWYGEARKINKCRHPADN